jgi:hypothetical protein
VLDDARDQEKPVMLFFSKGDSESPLGKQCLSFENFVLRNQKVFDAAEQFLRVKLDPFSVDRAILKQYKVKTAPTVVFLAYDGRVLGRVVAKSKPDRFLKAMQGVLLKNEALLAKVGKTAG